MSTINDWYTAGEAAKIITKNSNREVKPDYLRTLARLGKVTTRNMGKRTTLYLKQDVDAYVVEDRGVKVARVQKSRSTRAKKEKPAA